MDPATRILLTLDSHLSRPSDIRLMGGAAMILAYGMRRSTEDVDLLQDSDELLFLAENCDFGPALEATNADLAATGLYLSHIWGPEQEILTPEWRANCRPVVVPGLVHLRVTALGPLDLITSKLCRADAPDLADIEWVIDHERLSGAVVREAMRDALVPEQFLDGHVEACQRVEAILTRRGL